jgi:hypothetical protein
MRGVYRKGYLWHLCFETRVGILSWWGWYYAIWDAAVNARIMKLATGFRVVKYCCTLLYLTE